MVDGGHIELPPRSVKVSEMRFLPPCYVEKSNLGLPFDFSKTVQLCISKRYVLWGGEAFSKFQLLHLFMMLITPGLLLSVPSAQKYTYQLLTATICRFLQQGKIWSVSNIKRLFCSRHFLFGSHIVNFC